MDYGHNESSDDSVYLTASDEESETDITEEENIKTIPTFKYSKGTMAAGDVIELWKFGNTSRFTTLRKDTGMTDVLSIAASSIYGGKTENISLFHQHRVLESWGTISEHVISSTGSAKIYIVQGKQTRSPKVSFTSQKDMINQWENSSRVQMSCGHGITPDNLYDYSLSQLKHGYSTFKCPAIPDPDRIDQCGRLWDFTEVRQKADLSNDECNMFEMMLSYNKIQQDKDVHMCHLCGKFIESNCSQNGYCICQGCDGKYGGTYKFCVFCLQPWQSAVAYGFCGNSHCSESLQKRKEVLSHCPNKAIVGVPNCPTVRACPACNYLVQHDGDVCKHMECPSIHCRTKFCFICLKIKTDQYYWPCGGAFEPCVPVSRQTI